MIQFSFYGHSCFLLEAAGKKFLFDPFITPNEQAKDIDIKSIEADYIFVSHGHGDHTFDLVNLALQTGATVISNFEIVTWAQNKGVQNAHPMNFGTTKFEFGRVTYFQAMHSSSFEDGSYAGSPGGFIIEFPEGTVYYSGDTSLFLDMKLVPWYAKPDVAILPVGGNFTMNVEEAAKACEFIECTKVVGVHFDTFGFIKIDHEEAVQHFEKQHLSLLLPQIGKTYTILP